MKSPSKRLVVAIGTAFIIIGTSISFAANSPETKGAGPVKIVTSAEEVAQAGFSYPKIQLPDGNGNYPKSASYFWVGDGAKPTPTNNLVMVSAVTIPEKTHTLWSYGPTQKDFPIAGGTGKEIISIGTRTIINFIKNGTYVVVIGPTAPETENLATLVASKI